MLALLMICEIRRNGIVQALPLSIRYTDRFLRYDRDDKVDHIAHMNLLKMNQWYRSTMDTLARRSSLHRPSKVAPHVFCTAQIARSNGSKIGPSFKQ